MTRRKLVIASHARADIEHHRAWLLQNAGARASTVVLSLVGKQIAHLRRWPLTGVARSEYGSGIRSRLAGSYTIYHRLTPGELTILRVLHAKQDHDAILLAEPLTRVPPAARLR